MIFSIQAFKAFDKNTRAQLLEAEEKTIKEYENKIASLQKQKRDMLNALNDFKAIHLTLLKEEEKNNAR